MIDRNKSPLKFREKYSRGRTLGLPKLVRERSALADPYCHSAWNSVGSRALALADPYCQSTWNSVGSRVLALADPYCQSRWDSVCGCVCLSATLRSNISKTKGARRKVTIGSL